MVHSICADHFKRSLLKATRLQRQKRTPWWPSETQNLDSSLKSMLFQSWKSHCSLFLQHRNLALFCLQVRNTFVRAHVIKNEVRRRRSVVKVKASNPCSLHILFLNLRFLNRFILAYVSAFYIVLWLYCHWLCGYFQYLHDYF